MKFKSGRWPHARAGGGAAAFRWLGGESRCRRDRGHDGEVGVASHEAGGVGACGEIRIASGMPYLRNSTASKSVTAQSHPQAIDDIGAFPENERVRVVT